MAYNADDYELNELIEHVGLTKPFTREEFAKTMARLLNALGNSGKTEQMQFYRDIEERITEEYLDDEGDLVIDQPSFKMPNVVKKRHTITINSDKRANRSESTSSFSWQLADEIDNVKQLSIESYNIPKSWNNITSTVGNHIFGISYEQPIKFYFDASGVDDEDEAVKAMSPANFDLPDSLSEWFGENKYEPTIGAGVMRSTTGRELTAFPPDLSNLDWIVTHDGTNYGITSTSHANTIAIKLMDTTPTPMSLLDLCANATAYKNSYEGDGETPPDYDINLDDLKTITLVKGTEGQVIDFSLQVLLTPADLSANNENYYRWYHQTDPPITEEEQLTLTELETRTDTGFSGTGYVTKFTTTSAKTFEVKPPRHFKIKTRSPTFSYIGIKTNGTVITNMRETGDNMLMFMIKNADVSLSEYIGTGGAEGNYVTDLSHDMIVNFLNSRQPVDFYDKTTPDIRGRTGELDVLNIADYRNLRHTYEERLNKYEPNNLIKIDTYETWSSFKEFIFSDNSMNVGTNMLKEDVPSIWEDISNITFSLDIEGIWEAKPDSSVAQPDPKYDISLTKVAQIYELELKPKTRQTTMIYFRIKDGHYGTFTSLLSTMNAMSPKTQYDNYKGDGTATKVNMSALETMLSHVIDTAIGIPSPNGITSHDMIRNAYKNDYGDTFFNTIDWKFEKDEENIKLSKMDGSGNAVQLVMYDPSMVDVFKGASLCGRSSNSESTVNIEPKNTLCNKILGLFNETDTNKIYLLDAEEAAPDERKRPDLRRVRNLNIMLIDYKNYAYVSNATQRDPDLKDVTLKTPWYYNEVVFDTSCNDVSGAFIEEAVPIYTAGGQSRQLTEAQIYSLNAIFESQEKKSTSQQLNYRYRDYFLYGIGVKDKPEIGSGANDGIMATYDSRKGKRVYTQPTRLTKFYLELVDQDYYPINLNGIDIELVLNIDTELNTNK